MRCYVMLYYYILVNLAQLGALGVRHLAGGPQQLRRRGQGEPIIS